MQMKYHGAGLHPLVIQDSADSLGMFRDSSMQMRYGEAGRNSLVAELSSVPVNR